MKKRSNLFPLDFLMLDLNPNRFIDYALAMIIRGKSSSEDGEDLVRVFDLLVGGNL